MRSVASGDIGFKAIKELYLDGADFFTRIGWRSRYNKLMYFVTMAGVAALLILGIWASGSTHHELKQLPVIIRKLDPPAGSQARKQAPEAQAVAAATVDAAFSGAEDTTAEPSAGQAEASHEKAAGAQGAGAGAGSGGSSAASGGAGAAAAADRSKAGAAAKPAEAGG